MIFKLLCEVNILRQTSPKVILGNKNKKLNPLAEHTISKFLKTPHGIMIIVGFLLLLIALMSTLFIPQQTTSSNFQQRGEDNTNGQTIAPNSKSIIADHDHQIDIYKDMETDAIENKIDGTQNQHSSPSVIQGTDTKEQEIKEDQTEKFRLDNT